jgi:hypothetical protein
MNLKDEFRWLWKYGLPAAPIFAVLVYGILRQLYATFYGTLGASPEEVGLGYQGVLALSGAGMFAFGLPIGAFALLRLQFLAVPRSPPASAPIRTIRLQASAIVLTVYRAVPRPAGGYAHPTCSEGRVEAGGRFGSG